MTVVRLSADELQWIINAVHDKQIFLIVDESTLSGIQYLNILSWKLGNTSRQLFVRLSTMPCATNSHSIALVVDDAVKSLGMRRNLFLFLLSDAAKYMVATGGISKSLYPKLFHVTCATHLLHICAMKVKSHFEDVDQLIAKVKSAVVKNKTRPAKFATIGCLPQLVVSRWGSWLNTVLYYAKK